MDQSLNEFKVSFDIYIENFKKSSIYTNYIKSKELLDNCVQASDILEEIKSLQKLRNKIAGDVKNDITVKIDKLHDDYDEIFEVAQFNHCYEKMRKALEEIKFIIEDIINKEVL